MISNLLIRNSGFGFIPVEGTLIIFVTINIRNFLCMLYVKDPKQYMKLNNSQPLLAAPLSEKKRGFRVKDIINLKILDYEN